MLQVPPMNILLGFTKPPQDSGHKIIGRRSKCKQKPAFACSWGRYNLALPVEDHMGYLYLTESLVHLQVPVTTNYSILLSRASSQIRLKALATNSWDIALEVNKGIRQTCFQESCSKLS